MEMEKMEKLELRVQKEVQRAKTLVERMNSLYQSLPRRSRGRFEEEIEGKIKTISSYRVPLQGDILQGDIWQVRLCLEHLPLKSPFWKITVFVQDAGTVIPLRGWDLTKILMHPVLDAMNKASLCGVLINTPDWPKLLDFISSALEQTGQVFDDVFQREIQRLDPDTVYLSGQLRNAVEHENSLMLVIKQTIPELQKAAQDLRDTRSFLGQSKTIKGIRESVERIAEDLEKAVR